MTELILRTSMTSILRRRPIWVVFVVLIGVWFGYFLTALVMRSTSYTGIDSKSGTLLYLRNGSVMVPVNKTKGQFWKPGRVFDCLTWEVRQSYSSDLLTTKYRIFPEVVDGGEGDAQRQKSFVEIYQKQLWTEEKDTMVDQSDAAYKASGPGATLEAAQGVMAVLHLLIDKLKRDLDKTTITILDLPCGDLQWMSHFLNTRSDIIYTGMDIVPELIAKHKRTYADKPNINFKQFDIVKSKLDNSYDLVICRMMFQHLLNADVLKALYHFSSSGSNYFAATTFPDVEKNEELVPLGGRVRFLNLRRPPFSLSPPVCTFPEPLFPDHHFAIWKLPLLQREIE